MEIHVFRCEHAPGSKIHEKDLYNEAQMLPKSMKKGIENDVENTNWFLMIFGAKMALKMEPKWSKFVSVFAPLLHHIAFFMFFLHPA